MGIVINSCRCVVMTVTVTLKGYLKNNNKKINYFEIYVVVAVV